MQQDSPVGISFGLANAYLLRGRKGEVLIDTGLPGLASRLLRALRRFGTSPDRLALCQNGWGFGMGLGRIIPPLADLPEAVGTSWDRLVAGGARRFFPGHGLPFDVEILQAKRAELGLKRLRSQ